MVDHMCQVKDGFEATLWLGFGYAQLFRLVVVTIASFRMCSGTRVSYMAATVTWRISPGPLK